MCDYSLHSVSSRPAKAGDMLVTTGFVGTASRGFCAKDQPGVAVCLMPGTELAFSKEPERDGPFVALLARFGIGRMASKLARFRKLNVEFEHSHHDALEFSNGKVIYLTCLREGQEAVVLQLPVGAAPKSPSPSFAKVASTDRAEA